MENGITHEDVIDLALQIPDKEWTEAGDNSFYTIKNGIKIVIMMDVTRSFGQNLLQFGQIKIDNLNFVSDKISSKYSSILKYISVHEMPRRLSNLYILLK